MLPSRRCRTIAALTAVVLAAARSIAPAAAEDCTDPARALGVARIVSIDATDGPVFGSITKQERERSFLKAKEVVLTFDDGPLPGVTRPILETLDRFCTKATFFSVGKMAIAYPELVREIMRRGHTMGTHTWSHPMSLPRLRGDQARDQIESGFAAVTMAAGQPIAPFFRFPGLNDSRTLVSHLETRGIATFTVDVVSNDSYIADTSRLVERTLQQAEAENGGIMLFHDIKPQTARALPVILAELKRRGFRVVHLKSKHPAKADERYVAAVAEHLAAKNPVALRSLVAITQSSPAPVPDPAHGAKEAVSGDGAYKVEAVPAAVEARIEAPMEAAPLTASAPDVHDLAMREVEGARPETGLQPALGPRHAAEPSPRGFAAPSLATAQPPSVRILNAPQLSPGGAPARGSPLEQRTEPPPALVFAPAAPAMRPPAPAPVAGASTTAVEPVPSLPAYGAALMPTAIANGKPPPAAAAETQLQPPVASARPPTADPGRDARPPAARRATTAVPGPERLPAGVTAVAVSPGPKPVVSKPVAPMAADTTKAGGQGIEVLAGSYSNQPAVPVAMDPVAKAGSPHQPTAASAAGPATLPAASPAAQGIEILAGSYDSRPTAPHPRRVEKPARAVPLSDTSWSDRLRDRLRESGQ